MPRPPNVDEISLGSLFPLLLAYYAALADTRDQGEYALDWTWDSFLEALSLQSKVQITPSQLKHLFYNFELICADRRYPTKALNKLQTEGLKSIEALRKEFPHLFKLDRHGWRMIDFEYKEKDWVKKGTKKRVWKKKISAASQVETAEELSGSHGAETPDEKSGRLKTAFEVE